MKKSQVYGHIFIYMLAIAITSFILIYGYNTIKQLRDNVDRASCLKLRNDIKNSVTSIISDYGTVRRKDFSMCLNYNMVCFVETRNAITDISSPSVNSPHQLDPIIKDSISSGTGKNAFFLAETAKESFYAGNITLESNDVLCIPARGGTLSLKLEGKGDSTLVKKWE